MNPTLETERLTLRRFRGGDLDAMIALHQDPAVMRFLGPLMTAEQTNDFLYNVVTVFDEQGWGLFCAELNETKSCIGFVGLNRPVFEAPFTPCVEIGWRLASSQWGRGLATEAAREVLRYALEDLALREVVAMTTRDNLASQRVMEKIGLVRDPDGDFIHPSLDASDPLAPHILYRSQPTD